MDYSGYRHIQVERQGRKLTLTLNRPEALNAINTALHEELSRIFYDVALDSEAEVIVLTGAGRAFSGGGDIEGMKRTIETPGEFERIVVEGKRIIFGMLDCEKPIIARVPGDAMGLGATIALFCDLIVAADTARFADPHVRVGLVAGDGGAVIWPQLIGYARAKEYLMLGKMMTAAEALELGMINRVTPMEDLDKAVDDLADQLLRGAAKAIRWTKVSINMGLKPLAHAILEASLAYELSSGSSDDHKEAVTAFLEKRRPVFTDR